MFLTTLVHIIKSQFEQTTNQQSLRQFISDFDQTLAFQALNLTSDIH